MVQFNGSPNAQMQNGGLLRSTYISLYCTDLWTIMRLDCDVIFAGLNRALPVVLRRLTQAGLHVSACT